MAKSNVGTTVKRIRRHLGQGHRQEQTVLTNNISTSDLVFSLNTLPPGIRPGVTIGIGLELMLVTAVDVTATDVTVARGFLDSDAAAHIAGDLVDISPRFSNLDIVDAMQSEVAGWGQTIYRVEDDTFAVNTSASTLELPVAWAAALGVISVRQSEIRSTADTVWPELDATLYRGTAGGFDGAPTSGLMLRFHEPIRSGAVHVTVALQFDSSVLETLTNDLLTDAHMDRGMIDLLELGAQRRLVSNTGDARGARSAQDEARRAEETPYGQMVSMSQLQMALYNKRHVEVSSLLRRKYPIRMQ